MARINLESIAEPKTTTVAARRPHWLWSGVLQTGQITLLTGPMSIGKSTLLTGLLRNLLSNRNFLGRCCNAGKAVVHSTAYWDFWDWQVRCARIGDHVAIDASRPYKLPTFPEWMETIEAMIEFRSRGELDLFVVDSIDSQFPDLGNADNATVFAPLRRLTASGAAVLLIFDTIGFHDDERPDDGLRGVIDSVDYAFELRDFGRNQYRQRQLVRLKGPTLAPERIPYEYDGAAGFTVLHDPETVRFENAWKVLKPMLQAANEPLTAVQIMARWPQSANRPIMSELQKWLKRASDERKVKRLGRGLRGDPFRYRLVR